MFNTLRREREQITDPVFSKEDQPEITKALKLGHQVTVEFQDRDPEELRKLLSHRTLIELGVTVVKTQIIIDSEGDGRSGIINMVRMQLIEKQAPLENDLPIPKIF